jgi:hypothetical protein
LIAYRVCKTLLRRYQRVRAEEFRRAVDRDLACDPEQEIDSAMIGRESVDLKHQVIGLQAAAGQDAQPIGQTMLLAPADPVTD